MSKVIVTIKVVDYYGQISTCNVVENEEDSFSHFKSRIEDLERKGFKRTGDMTIQFVEHI